MADIVSWQEKDFNKYEELHSLGVRQQAARTDSANHFALIDADLLEIQQ